MCFFWFSLLLFFLHSLFFHLFSVFREKRKEPNRNKRSRSNILAYARGRCCRLRRWLRSLVIYSHRFTDQNDWGKKSTKQMRKHKSNSMCACVRELFSLLANWYPSSSTMRVANACVRNILFLFFLFFLA